MAFSTESFSRYAFKVMQNTAHTSNLRDPANEEIVSNLLLSAETIWADQVDTSPVQANADGIVSTQVTLKLEPISGTNAGATYYTGWRLKINGTVPVTLDGKINRKTGLEYADNDYVGDIVPQSFGNDYRPIVKNNGTEVPPLDASDWFLDYAAGVLTQETTNQVNYGTTGTVDCYIYIGRFVADALDNLSGDIDGGSF
jgi:hypothetical protein